MQVRDAVDLEVPLLPTKEAAEVPSAEQPAKRSHPSSGFFSFKIDGAVTSSAMSVVDELKEYLSDP